MNALARLLLKHLDLAGGHAVPEETLKSNLCDLVRPRATDMQWDDVVIDLLQREMIGFVRDEIDDTKKFYLKEKGQVALRRFSK